MAEPFAIVGGVASILQIITSVTKLAKNLNEVRQSYDNVALNITLVASQLSTIRAALEALHTWRTTDTVETEASKQLDQDLGLSLSCCAILISVIDSKLAESGFQAGVGLKQKIKYVWLEDILKEYVSNLEGQVRALQLLLTIFQCRTATEQKQQLAKAESRSIIEQIRAETMSLSVGDTEMDDAISILSHDPSVRLDVDAILMKSPAYLRVYGERDSARRRKGSKPSPPPPPRRNKLPKVLTPPSALDTETTLPLPSVKPLPKPPVEVASQPSPCPPEDAPYSLPVPPRSKVLSQPQEAVALTYSGEQQPSQRRINVWDYLGAGEEGKVRDSLTMDMADSAQVFELSAASEFGTISEKVNRDSQVPIAAALSLSDKHQMEGNGPDLVKPEIPPPPIDPATTEKISAQSHQDLKMKGPNLDDNGKTILERPTSLEGFRTQIDVAFEKDESSDTRLKDLRLSLGMHGSKSAANAAPLCEEVVILSQEHLAARDVVKVSSYKGLESMDKDVIETTGNAIPSVRKTLSIHSDVDLYEASVRNMPMSERSSIRPQSSVRHETIETERSTFVKDEMDAEAEGLSVLDQQLASKHVDTKAANDSISSAPTTRSHVSKQSGSGETQKEDQIDECKFIVASSEMSQSPQIIMTPSNGDAEIQNTNSTPSLPNAIQSPISPSLVPPAPPTFASSIPTIPVSSPPFFEMGTKISGTETSTASSGRDSSVFEASSTISSSEQSVDHTISSLQQSTSNTTATSIGMDGAASAREQAQYDLRRLQSELTAAKDRGDSQAFQDSVQKSIEVIRRTYLASTSSETKKSSNLRERASFKRFSSLTGSSNGSALCDAAAGGNLTSLKALLHARVNIDTRGKAFMTPMMLAAINGHTECMSILRQHGADEFAVDAKGRSVLHLAVASNRAAVVRWLLNSYPPPRPQPLKHKPSILSKATESLMARSPKNLRETSDAEGSKPIHISLETDRGSMLEILLAAGVDIESKNNWIRTPLHQAIISGRRDSFDVLLRNGANINALDAKSMSPLHWAAKTGHADMIQPLLAKGADRHDFNNDGNQPIHEAAWVGEVPCVEAILRERKELEVPTKPGESLLHIACLTKNSELMTYLLNNNIEVNPWAAPQPSLWNALSKFKVPLSSLTPLHYACCKGDLATAMHLLDHEAWINAATPEGVTALMMAAESEDTNTINLLLSRGAKVNASMPGTLLTALHIASRRGDLESVQQLCRAGANRHARAHASGSNYGRTPLEETTAKCADKTKRFAVEGYYRTIRQNELKNARIRPLGEQRQSSDMAGGAYGSGPSLDVRPAQPISYAPWGQHNVVPIQQGQYGYQQQLPVTYPVYMQPMQMQISPQWYDPDPLNHVESPPPYQPGSNVSTRLAAQAAVHRPSDNAGT